ncbi:hypothetical protein MTR_5g018180 [Medicago truncatula]|uniref:Uncharacterized protein n=1 Tax=Medicago truncatula TaxID=3880 RepID=G7K9D1_MEDTR|nr:hypothetical protein MTR_5g018180 [Medicago truncatula]
MAGIELEEEIENDGGGSASLKIGRSVQLIIVQILKQFVWNENRSIRFTSFREKTKQRVGLAKPPEPAVSRLFARFYEPAVFRATRTGQCSGSRFNRLNRPVRSGFHYHGNYCWYLNMDWHTYTYVGGKFELGCGMLIRITTLETINAKIREGKIRLNNSSSDKL